MPLKNIPVGTVIHNVEMKPGKGAQIARSAGSSVNLLAVDSGKAIIKLNSGEIKNVADNCFATVGTVSNLENKNIKIGSAGRKRWLGFRPKVRGVAMNPIDHLMVVEKVELQEVGILLLLGENLQKVIKRGRIKKQINLL